MHTSGIDFLQNFNNQHVLERKHISGETEQQMMPDKLSAIDMYTLT